MEQSQGSRGEKLMSKSAFEKRDKKLGCGCKMCREARRIGRLDALRWALRQKSDVRYDFINTLHTEIKKCEGEK
jgi:hypothetical protein